jgi:hypothetical protein
MTVGATATVLGGFWPQNGVGTLTSANGESGGRRIVRHNLGEQSLMRMRALMTALNGVAPGAVAAKTIGRTGPSTAAVNDELGGVRPIFQFSIVNRVTTAADVTEILTDFLSFVTLNTFGANPPANLDRNPLGTR